MNDEALLDFADALENAALILKQRIGKQMKKPEVSEEPFLAQKWEKREGNRLHEFEVSTKILNPGSENFQRCLSILKQNNATIGNRFKDVGWTFSYWVYGENIYRQQLKS